MYIVVVIMSMQLFHRWDIQNGGKGIDQEIQIMGKGKVTNLGHLIRQGALT